MRNEKLIEAILKKSIELRKMFTSPTNVWKAMDQCGVPGNDPSRKELFKAVMTQAKKEAAEVKRMHASKEKLHLAQARANELSHPEDARRNDL